MPVLARDPCVRDSVVRGRRPHQPAGAVAAGADPLPRHAPWQPGHRHVRGPGGTHPGPGPGRCPGVPPAPATTKDRVLDATYGRWRGPTTDRGRRAPGPTPRPRGPKVPAWTGRRSQYPRASVPERAAGTAVTCRPPRSRREFTSMMQPEPRGARIVLRSDADTSGGIPERPAPSGSTARVPSQPRNTPGAVGRFTHPATTLSGGWIARSPPGPPGHHRRQRGHDPGTGRPHARSRARRRRPPADLGVPRLAPPRYPVPGRRPRRGGPALPRAGGVAPGSTCSTPSRRTPLLPSSGCSPGSVPGSTSRAPRRSTRASRAASNRGGSRTATR